MADISVVEHKRATVRPDKGGTVAELTQRFTGATAALLTEYRGLTVKQITDLRVALGADTTYCVVKNTLTKIAAGNAGLEGLDGLLAGPTAVAFVSGDPVTAAKALREFAKANPALVVKGGVMDGKPLTPDEIKRLADLESREVLLAKMAGALKASLTNAVYLFAAPLSQAARALGALEAKATADPSVLAGGIGVAALEDTAPAAEVTPADGGAGTEDSADAPAAEAAGTEHASEAPVAEASTETSTETSSETSSETSTESE